LRIRMAWCAMNQRVEPPVGAVLGALTTPQFA
jgi:hypothetical protein